MTRRKTISAVFAAVLVVLAGGAAVTLAATSTGGNATNAIQDETTTVAGNETTVAVNETTTAEPVETATEVGETETEVGDEPVDEAGESFNISDLGAPNTAVAGDTITVNATVTNNGTESDTQSVEFRLDGDLVERQEVTLEGGESENVTFQVDTTGLEPGLYIHGVQTQDFGEVDQLTILDQGEDEVEETTTEEEVVEETTTEEEVVEETTTEEEVVEETTTEEVVEETTTEEEVVEETTTEEEVVEETTTEEEVVEETTTEEEVVEETTTEEEVVEETPTEIEVGEPPEVQAPDQLVFQIEQMQIDEWSFVIGDSETPDRTETVENIEIRDRTQRINLTELMQEDGTIEDAMDDGQIQTPTEAETPGEVGSEDLETVRVVIRNVTIENVTFIVELPDEEEFEMPETPAVETPTEIEETPTEIEETTTEVADTPTEIEETPTEVEETPTEIEETPTEIEETPTEVEETPTEVADTPTEIEETPTEVEETPTEVGETTTEAEIGETTTEAEIAAQSFEIEGLDAPESAAIGDPVTVSAEISNPGDQESTQEVEFRLDGDLVERQEVTLAAGETENVTFEVDTTGLEAGTYVHGVLTDEFGELALITLEEGVEETVTEVEETTTEVEVNETETEVGETTTEAAAGAEAEASFADQESDGATVTVDSVTLSEGGFVTIHDETLLEGDALGSVVGTSEYLEAGTHENVTVELDEPLTESQTLIAMPHQDTNENQQYDFVDTEGAEDGPYVTAEGDAVVDPGNVTVGTAEGTTTEA